MLRTNYLKKLLLILFLAISGNKAFAQAAAYAFSQSTGTYTPLSGATVLSSGSGMDDATFAVPIPSFVYNGVTYTDVYVSENGYVSFGTTNPGTSTRSFISGGFGVTLTDGGISGYSRDLGGVDATSQLAWSTSGSVTTFEWTNMANYFSTAESLNFQIQLDNSNNTLSVVYGTMTTTGSSSGQVGIRTTTADFSNRTTTTDWFGTTPGSTNTATVSLSPTVFPTPGLTFTWTAPTCLPPSAITGNNVTTTNADITWTEPSPAPAGGYEYEVRSSGAPGSGATGLDATGTSPTGTTTTTVTTLNPATTYTVYMRGICGPGDTSAWIAGNTFTTNCIAIANLPWTENFDALVSNPSTGTIPLPNCWTLESGSWTTSNSTFNAGPFSGTNFLRISWGQTNAWVWSPGFTLTAGTSYDFSFWWRGDNYSTWDGAVGVSSTPNSSGVTMLGTPFITSGTTASTNYQLVTYTFVPTTTGDYYFGLQVNEPTSNPWYLSFDDFALDITPTCTAPTGVTASNITSSSVDINWTAASSGGVGYEYEVRTSGTGGSGTTGLQSSGTVAFGTNTVSISGLASLTSYAVYVRTDCGSGSYSMWIPVNFLTSIDCATATPIASCGASQSFTVPSGNGVYNNYGGPFGTPGIETLFSFTAPLTGPYTLNITSTNSQWVDYFFGDASNGCGASNFTFIDDIFSPGLSSTFNLTAGVTYYILADPEGTAGASQTFDIICPATCGEPTTVNATNITTNSADIDWVQPAPGTPAQWEISYGPSGTTAGSGTVVLVSSNPSTISGLSQSTAYDVYVRAICSPGDTSTWSAAGSFTTLTSCFTPTGLTTTNVTATSVDFSWTAPATPPAIGYEYEVRTSGAPGSGATGLVNSSAVVAGVTTATVSGLNSATGYKVYVRSICGAGDTSAWTSATNFATVCVPPTVTSTTGGSNCGTGPVTLSATGTGSTFYWYTNNTTDTVAGTGASFTTPSLSSTTTYYVASANTTNYTGLGNTSIPTSTGASNPRGIIVQTSQSFTLNSAQFYSTVTSGTIAGTATLVDDVTGTTLVTTPFSFTAGSSPQWYTMTLGWNLSAGNTYRLVAQFTSGSVSRIIGSADYTTPAFNNLGALGTILSGYDQFGVGTTYTDYSYFHNIDATSICASTRSAVVATVGGSSTSVNLGNDTTLCSGGSLTLNAGNPGATYVWSTGATTQTITVSTAGTYSVAVTLAGGCTGNDTIVVNTGTTPMVMLGNDTALCTGASLTLNAGNAGATYSWSTGATTQNITVSAPGTYRVTVTNPGGCIGRDTIVVTNGQPTVNLGPNTSICTGSSVTLDAGAGGTMYMWSTGAMTQTITVSTPGTYTVAVTSAAGCTGNDTIVISPAAPLVVNLGNDTTICTGNSLTLNAGNAGATYSWSTGATTQNITVATAGTYSVTVTNAGGCIGRDTIVVNTATPPMPMLGNDTTICAGATLTLNAGAGTSYLWNNGTTTQTVSVTTTTPGTTTYSVMVMNAAGCTGRDTINVTVSPLPMVMLGNDTAVCVGNTLTLNAGNVGSSYVWSTGATTQTISVTAGTYSVTVTNGVGCMGMDTINISTATPPTPMLGNDTTFCAGNSITLNAGPGSTYSWNTGATTQSLVVATTGTYSVVVTNAAGCTGTDAIVVTVDPLPTAGTINVSSASPTFTFTVTGNQNDMVRGFDFGDGTVDTTGASTNGGPTTSTHTYTANGTYTVRYIVGNLCGTDTVDVVVPVTNVGVNTVTLNGEVTLSPNPATDRVVIRNSNTQAMKHITVLNAVGAVVRDTTPQNGKEHSIDLSGLAAATYMVRIEFDGGNIVVRRLQITQ